MIVLAIDQAATSGWAILSCAPMSLRLVEMGVAKTMAERERVVWQARDAAHNIYEWLVVMEDHSDFHFGRGNASVASLLGMGAVRGRWEEQLDRAQHPAKLRAKVTPKTWRKAVLGLPGNATAERAKEAAIAYVVACLTISEGADRPEHNAAEAYCMGAYAARELLPEAQSLIERASKKRKVVA